MEKAKMPIDKLLASGAKWYLKELDEPPYIMEEIDVAATIYTEDGRMLCGLSPKWDEWTDHVKNEVLCHEAGHVAGGHDIRRKEREPRKWNIICDAAIHYSKGVDAKVVEEIGGVTYEKIGLPPVPPEVGYDMLPDSPCTPKCQGNCKGKPGEGHDPGEHQPGCGRDKHGSGKDLSSKATTRALIASVRGAAAIGEGATKSNGGGTREIPEVQPAYPDWMVDLLNQLKKVVSYDEPTRRWIKESRLDIEPIMMPGKAAKLGIACTFIWDLSGSISADEVGKFLSAVDATPELQGSEVVAFSDGVAGPRPVREARELLKECPSGGTQFHKGASKRRPGVPCVWITDGYTGDGWPQPHDSDEFWVINTDVIPPHGIRIQSK